MLESGNLMFRWELVRGKCFTGARSHGWVIAHLLDTQNETYLWKAGGFVVPVRIT